MKVMNLIIIIVIMAGIIYWLQTSKHSPSQPNRQVAVISTTPAVLGQQTKFTDCNVNNALPDSACTPGAILPNATKEEICTPGYSKTVRNVPYSLKEEVYAEYGVATHQPGQYEVDHLISLELGGSNDISNLWPEPAEPRPGFHEKDQLENYLHDQVCNGSISLQDAQHQISSNWLQVYTAMPK